MQPFVVDSFCGCFDLRTGSLIIGYINLVSEIFIIILGLSGLMRGSMMAAMAETEEARQAGVALAVHGLIMLLVALFFIVFTLALLVGILENKREYVQAFLLASSIPSFISFISLTDQNLEITMIREMIRTYFLLVVRSYFYEMEDRRHA